jgi:5'-3' exonuclease
MIKNNNVDIMTDKFPQLNYFIVSQLKQILVTLLVTDQRIEDLTRSGHCDVSYVYDQMQIQQSDPEPIIKDYIVMSFFLGNDFLPSFPTLKIRNNGIEKVIAAYRATIKINHGHFYQAVEGSLGLDSTLNLDFCLTFIQQLSLSESYDFQTIAQTRAKHLKFNHSSNPTNCEEALDQYQKIEHLYQDPINPYDSGWQDRYYQYFFHIKCDDDTHRQTQINRVCYDYLEALSWNVQYYFKQCDDWQWFYHHEATPVLTDLLQYLKTNHPPPFVINPRDPMKPYHQLMMILPPQSAELLPIAYRTYMLSDCSPLIHYYPIDFDFEYYGNRYRWESHPKIPLVEPVELLRFTEQIDTLLSPLEKQRGQLGQPKIKII